MRLTVLILLFSFVQTAAQSQITGKIVDENGNGISSVLIVNIQTDQQTTSNSLGEFIIPATQNEELRFIKSGSDRFSKNIKNEDFGEELIIKLQPTVIQIEEVKIARVKLTGNLEKDAQNLAKNNKTDKLNSAIGVPNAPEKPREKPAETVNDVLLPMLTGSLNVQAVYDIVSGDARRKKHLYQHEDFQDDVSWMWNRLGQEYFDEAEIPKQKIREFIEYSLRENPKIRMYIRAKNFSSAMLLMDEIVPRYLQQTKVK